MVFLGAVMFFVATVQPSWSQAKGHASVGMGRGEEGYLALKEMVRRLEFSLKMQDASPEMKLHVNFALKHAREALLHYDEALKHTNESLGRTARNPMTGGEGAGMEGSHKDGGHGGPPPPQPPMGMPEGSHQDGHWREHQVVDETQQEVVVEGGDAGGDDAPERQMVR